MTAESTSSQLPDQPRTDQDKPDRRLVRWLKARRFDADFWLNYTLLPWLRDTAGPWAGRRVREIGRAFEEGWSGTVAWIRALVWTACVLLAIDLLDWGAQLLVGFWQHTMIGAHHNGVLATITGPVHAYINAHAVGLQTSPATVWALWQLAAPVLLVLAFTGSVAARLAWCGYGAATAAAVWMAAPDPGRPVALALTVATWALASVVALFGMRLLPLVVVNVTPPRLTGRPARAVRPALPPAQADQ